MRGRDQSAEVKAAGEERLAVLTRGSLPKMTLSGIVPDRLTNRLVLRTRAPRREEGEEDVDDAVEISSSDFFDPIERPYYFLG